MQLGILENMTIGEVRERFNQAFPFLKLQFFYRSPMAEPMAAHEVAPSIASLQIYKLPGQTGRFIIDGSDSTEATERKFLKAYGLHVQVLRRSRATWLVTTTTDYYSLNDQNLIGMEMAMAVNAPELIDVHE